MFVSQNTIQAVNLTTQIFCKLFTWLIGILTLATEVNYITLKYPHLEKYDPLMSVGQE